MDKFEVAVIGGGPAGLTAALYLLRARRKVLLVEKLSPGGQVLLTEKIENYPGFPEGITGFELADAFAAQVEKYEGLHKHFGEVKKIEVGDKYHTLHLEESTVQVKALVVASGARWRKLGVPGEQELAGKGISYCAICDGNFFRDQVVACIGGGDTALEESLYLSKIVKKIYLIHRRDKFRGTKIYQEKVLANPKIEVIWDSVVEEFKGQESLEKVVLKNVKNGNTSELEVSGAFIFIGVEPNSEFLPPEVKKDERGFVLTDSEMQTNIKGIYAAGDIRAKNCRQVSTAVGDGACAGFNVANYLEQLDD
ncbi:MAG TPA: thioredoxin-disulfide reductase [Desulfonauticus sp.]|jgi:thioredoxin reductase (NADPH)|nr:MAG: FAD-dependent pyridine nucleotide-disulfide oxidoreductase [Desulfonauticus sp. 38_4375]MDK2921833.1 thioredoxin reductase [Desulfonauticus sp.]HCO12363.1 thioredoxin-disulfide reductase [Desulfonauticus sp.]